MGTEAPLNVDIQSSFQSRELKMTVPLVNVGERVSLMDINCLLPTLSVFMCYISAHTMSYQLSSK